jgi:hypothetical protein
VCRGALAHPAAQMAPAAGALHGHLMT